MDTTAQIGTALVGGYLLGRTKKAKAALGLAMWLAGKGRPRDLLREGLIQLAKSPEVSKLLTQARGPLLDSARSAATATLNTQLGSFADQLNQRTGLLTGEFEPIEGGSADDEEGSSAQSRAQTQAQEAPKAAKKATAGATSTARKAPAKKASATKSATTSTAKRSSDSAKKAPAQRATGSSGTGSTSRRQASSRRSSR